jgi:hypothetical protein
MYILLAQSVCQLTTTPLPSVTLVHSRQEKRYSVIQYILLISLCSSESIHLIGDSLVNHGAKDLWLLKYMKKLMACRDEFIEQNKVREFSMLKFTTQPSDILWYNQLYSSLFRMIQILFVTHWSLHLQG